MRNILLACLLVSGASLALAHHSYSAFNMDKSIVVNGTVKKMDWSNPHSWIWLDVANDQGVVETWGIEGMSPNYPRSARLDPDDLCSPAISFPSPLHPLRSGDKGGSFVSRQAARRAVPDRHDRSDHRTLRTLWSELLACHDGCRAGIPQGLRSHGRHKHVDDAGFMPVAFALACAICNLLTLWLPQLKRNAWMMNVVPKATAAVLRKSCRSKAVPIAKPIVIPGVCVTPASAKNSAAASTMPRNMATAIFFIIRLTPASSYSRGSKCRLFRLGVGPLGTG